MKGVDGCWLLVASCWLTVAGCRLGLTERLNQTQRTTEEYEGIVIFRIMTNERIILQGGGEHARVVLDCLLESDREVLAIFDPRYSGDLYGVPQKGKYQSGFENDAHAIIAIGDNRIRKKVALRSAHSFTNAIHRSAIVSSRSVMGTGNMILHGVIVQAQTRIGNHTIVNTGAQIDHDCVIGDFVHIAPGTIICGTVSIGEGTFVGAGAVVIPGKKIGSWATIGAGTVVINDVPDFAVVVGNPGRIVKYQPAAELQ